MGHIDYMDYLRKSRKLIPRLKIISSKSVWVAAIATFGQVFLYFLLIVYTPMYLRAVHGYNILMVGIFTKYIYLQSFFPGGININFQVGILSGVPFMTSYFIGLIYSYGSHKMIDNGWDLTTIRKIWAAVGKLNTDSCFHEVCFLKSSSPSDSRNPPHQHVLRALHSLRSTLLNILGCDSLQRHITWNFVHTIRYRSKFCKCSDVSHYDDSNVWSYLYSYFGLSIYERRGNG